MNILCRLPLSACLAALAALLLVDAGLCGADAPRPAAPPAPAGHYRNFSVAVYIPWAS